MKEEKITYKKHTKKFTKRSLAHLWKRWKHVSSLFKILAATFGWLGQRPSQPNANWLAGSEVKPRATERWERWERVPSQFKIFAATFG